MRSRTVTIATALSAMRLNNLPKVIQLAPGRIRIPTAFVRLRSLCFGPRRSTASPTRPLHLGAGPHFPQGGRSLLDSICLPRGTFPSQGGDSLMVDLRVGWHLSLPDSSPAFSSGLLHWVSSCTPPLARQPCPCPSTISSVAPAPFCFVPSSCWAWSCLTTCHMSA